MAGKNYGQPINSTTDGQIRTETNEGRQITTDGIDDRMLIGQRLDGTIGVDIAPPGVDVKTATLQELIFSDRTRTFTIAEQGVKDVTRAAGATTGSQNVLLNSASLGRVMFFVTVSPTNDPYDFNFATPRLTYALSGSDSGKLWSVQRAMYDPDIPVIRFYVETTSIAPNFNTSETWYFSYILLYQNIPS